MNKLQTGSLENRILNIGWKQNENSVKMTKQTLITYTTIEEKLNFTKF